MINKISNTIVKFFNQLDAGKKGRTPYMVFKHGTILEDLDGRYFIVRNDTYKVVGKCSPENLNGLIERALMLE